MCGRYTLASPNPAEVRARFNIAESIEVRQRYNIAPGQPLAVVVTEGESTALVFPLKDE